MLSHNRIYAAGQELRKLRQQRGLTLEQVATSVGISAPVLSRKERGEQMINREDIRTIIERFGLTPWEAYTLWTTAGFIPETIDAPDGSSSLHEAIREVLRKLAFPACVLTPPGYFLAWNQAFEATYHPSRCSPRPLHVLDLLFHGAPAPEMDRSWNRSLWQVMRVFYQWTPRIAHEPDFTRLLNDLSRRYGDAFDRQWYNLQVGNGSQIGLSDLGEPAVVQGSPYGDITYLVMRASFAEHREYELVVLVPCGAASQQRYQRVREAIGGERLYRP